MGKVTHTYIYIYIYPSCFATPATVPFLGGLVAKVCQVKPRRVENHAKMTYLPSGSGEYDVVFAIKYANDIDRIG